MAPETILVFILIYVLVVLLSATIIGLNKIPMWSALALGTNLGGAATPFSGAVVIMALGAMKKEGITLNFSEFTKVGFITTFIQLAFATVYIIVRFGIGG